MHLYIILGKIKDGIVNMGFHFKTEIYDKLTYYSKTN